MNNVLRKRLIIRKMKRRIRRALRKCIRIKDLVYQRPNFRDSVDYDSPRFQELVQNMKESGFFPGKLVLVNVIKDADGTLRIPRRRERLLNGIDALDMFKSGIPK